MAQYPKINFKDEDVDYDYVYELVKSMDACAKANGLRQSLVEQSDVLLRAMSINKEKGNTQRFEQNVRDGYKLLYNYADCYDSSEVPAQPKTVTLLPDMYSLNTIAMIAIDGGEPVLYSAPFEFINEYRVYFASPDTAELYSRFKLFNGSSKEWVLEGSDHILVDENSPLFNVSEVSLAMNTVPIDVVWTSYTNNTGVPSTTGDINLLQFGTVNGHTYTDENIPINDSVNTDLFYGKVNLGVILGSTGGFNATLTVNGTSYNFVGADISDYARQLVPYTGEINITSFIANSVS